MSGDNFGCHKLAGNVLVASSGWKPGRCYTLPPLNAQKPSTKHFLAQNVQSPGCEILCWRNTTEAQGRCHQWQSPRSQHAGHTRASAACESWHIVLQASQLEGWPGRKGRTGRNERTQATCQVNITMYAFQQTLAPLLKDGKTHAWLTLHTHTLVQRLELHKTAQQSPMWGVVPIYPWRERHVSLRKHWSEKAQLCNGHLTARQNLLSIRQNKGGQLALTHWDNLPNYCIKVHLAHRKVMTLTNQTPVYSELMVIWPNFLWWVSDNMLQGNKSKGV